MPTFAIPNNKTGVIAQLVEQRTENPCVFGSIPKLGIKKYGILAQSVEHLTFNQVVWGSIPQCLIFLRKVEIPSFLLQKSPHNSIIIYHSPI